MSLQSLRQQRQIAARLDKWLENQRPSENDKGDEPVENLFSPSPTSWDEFDNDLNPKNWSFSRKLIATLLVTAISFTVQFASAIDSAAAEKIQHDFGVSAVTESLATGLFLVGFAIGAPVAGPLSEIAGRNPIYIVNLVVFMLCTMGAGLAPNIGAQLALRFLAGMFGSAPLVCAGGTVADLWTPRDQIHIFPIYATGGFLGLAVGPAVGGVIGESKLVGWRWVEWSTLILSAVVLVMILLLQPETYAPVLLRWKASMLAERWELKSERTATNIEASQITTPPKARNIGRAIRNALLRPLQLAFSEPIIVMISLYLSVLYIVIFTFLPGYVFIFTDTYAFGPALRGVSFLGMGVGFLLALLLVIPVTVVSRNIMEKSGSLPPEARLYYAMCGAPTIPVSLLWMGWTVRTWISPWSAIAASALFGFGVLCVFFSSYQYIIHTYAQSAASGLVFITLARYLVAGGMIVVGIPMYGNLGVAWTLTILGCLAGLLVPIPFCLFWFGPTIRKWSKNGN